MVEAGEAMSNLRFSVWAIAAGLFIFSLADGVGQVAGFGVAVVGVMVFIYEVLLK